jgi:hypothetical protein
MLIESVGLKMNLRPWDAPLIGYVSNGGSRPWAARAFEGWLGTNL